MRIIFAVLPLVIACGSPPKKEPPPPPAPQGPSTPERFRQAADQFFDAYLERNPGIGAQLGLHQLDGKLPNLTAEGIKADVEWLKAQLAAIEAFPAAELDGTSGIEREVLLAEIRGQLFDLDVLRLPFRNPMYYVELLELVQ